MFVSQGDEMCSLRRLLSLKKKNKLIPDYKINALENLENTEKYKNENKNVPIIPSPLDNLTFWCGKSILSY